MHTLKHLNVIIPSFHAHSPKRDQPIIPISLSQQTMLSMRNSISATLLSTRCRLLTFLLVFAGAFQASAQIDVDDFNTGPFSIYGISSSNDIIATGAIEGKRDAKIANLVSSTSFANKTLETTGAYARALKITP